VRRRAAAAIFWLALAGCGGPEPQPGTIEYARKRDKERRDAEDRVRDYDAAHEQERIRLGMGGGAGSIAKIRQDLLAEYGPRLTPFQRSALLTAPLASRDDGETMCRKWIAENEAFERGSSPGGE
jgi:hypothetical protein